MDNFQTLKTAGYIEVKTLVLPFSWWLNFESRMGFGFDAVEDADPKWLREAIVETVTAGQFIFYIAHGATLDSAGCRQILLRAPEANLAPKVRLVRPAR